MMVASTSMARSDLVRVLLVDDESLLRSGIKLLLESHAGIKVIGEAPTCQEGARIAQEYLPQVALISLTLGGKSIIGCLPGLLDQLSGTRLLILSDSTDLELHYQAVSLGAVGVVKKTDGIKTLVKAIRKVSRGEVWLDGMLTARLLDDLRRAREVSNDHHQFAPPSDAAPDLPARLSLPPEEAAKIALLTDRELQVVDLIAEGLRNQQIASRLFISSITVRHHLSSIFSKLDVPDRLALAIYAYRYRLVDLPRHHSSDAHEEIVRQAV